MSESMVERVAKALAGDEWNYPHDRERHMRDALDAIKAMRDPTEAILALSDSMGGNELCDNADHLVMQRVWERAIDAALAGNQPA
jgi:hypothetical protein